MRSLPYAKGTKGARVPQGEEFGDHLLVRAAEPPSVQPPQPTGPRRGRGVPGWVWWAVGLAVVGAFVAYVGWPRSGGATAAPPPSPTEIAVGDTPRRIAVDAAGTFAVVAESGSDAVGIVDLVDRAVVATIPVGDEPTAVALSADGTAAYVPNYCSDTLSVIDVAGRSVVATIPVGDGPVDVALSPDGRRAYVSNADRGSVSIVDTAERVVVGEVNVARIWGDTLGGIAVSPDGSRVLVSATRLFFEDDVFVIDTAEAKLIGDGIRAGEAPQGIAFGRDGRLAYVANSGADTLSVIDVATGTETAAVEVGSSPQNVVVSADGRSAYVTSPRSGSVTVVDLTTNLVTRTLSVQGSPVDLAIAGGNAHVVHQDSSVLTIHGLTGSG
jgi:YVTN family beta-propeller protein